MSEIYNLDQLTEIEKEQIENFDATPLDNSSEPVPHWKKRVDHITELLS